MKIATGKIIALILLLGLLAGAKVAWNYRTDLMVYLPRVDAQVRKLNVTAMKVLPGAERGLIPEVLFFDGRKGTLDIHKPFNLAEQGGSRQVLNFKQGSMEYVVRWLRPKKKDWETGPSKEILLVEFCPPGYKHGCTISYDLIGDNIQASDREALEKYVGELVEKYVARACDVEKS